MVENAGGELRLISKGTKPAKIQAEEPESGYSTTRHPTWSGLDWSGQGS